MKKFTKKLKDKGWMARDVAERWGITANHLSRLSSAPGQPYIDAAEGLPSIAPGRTGFDDFEEVVESKSLHDLTLLVLSTMEKHGWTDQETRALPKALVDMLDYAEMVKAHRIT
jgi:hypothetical protein